MSLRLPLVLVAAAIGLVGLALNFYVIAGVMGPPQNRSFASFLVYFISFLTNLSNIALLLVYLSDHTRWGWLGWFRRHVTRGGMAGIMMLVMFFYHFMLAPTLPEVPQAITVSNILLHYITPLLYLSWWVVWVPHGGLRWHDVPEMLLPGLAYTAYAEVRGLVVGEYPYEILDPTLKLPDGSVTGYGIVFVSVGVLVLLVAAFDALLVMADWLLTRMKRATL
jgi:hypothetical protein